MEVRTVFVSPTGRVRWEYLFSKEDSRGEGGGVGRVREGGIGVGNMFACVFQ